MKIELIGDLISQPDGSALAELDVDDEGKMYLMQLLFWFPLLKFCFHALLELYSVEDQ